MKSASSVCLLIGDAEIPEFIFIAIERMLEKTNAEISLVVLANGEHEDEGPDRLQPVEAVSGVLHAVQKWIVGRTRPTKAISNIKGIDSAKWVTCDPIDSSPGVKIPSEVVRLIETESDVVVHVGVGILRGDILSATPNGVLGFHHGDIRKHRGSHAGFWEFMNGEPVAGTTLQRLSGTLDAGEIIVFKEIDISDARTWPEVQGRLREASKDMLATAIERLNDPNFESVLVNVDDLGPIHYRSDMTTRVKIRYIFHVASNAITPDLNLKWVR